MNEHVVILGMIDSYGGPLDGTDVWAINRAYKHRPRGDKEAPYTTQAGLTRVYFFDKIELLGGDFVSDLNKLEGVGVYSRRVYDQVNNSKEFPLQEVIEHFNGHRYFVCTAAYMVAHALLLGYKKITLHGMYHFRDSMEYMHHVQCMNFWCGLAVGRGVELVMSDGAALCRTPPWQAPLYGYQRQATEWLANATLKGAYIACMHYPLQFTDAAGKEIEPPKQALSDMTDCEEVIWQR